jgi:hypothetical protein
MTRVSVPERGVESLFGTHDENLRLLEERFKVRIRGKSRGWSSRAGPWSS